MFRITVLTLAVFLLGACASTSTNSIGQPTQPVVVTATVPALASNPVVAESSASVAQPSAPKPPTSPLPLLSFEEYTEAIFRVAGPYTFTIPDRVLRGASEPVVVKMYQRDLMEGVVNLMAGGDMASSVVGHAVKQYEAKPFAKGRYQAKEGLVLVLARSKFAEPTEPAEPLICVSPELLGGIPPKGYECCLLPPAPEYGWLLKLDTEEFCKLPIGF